MEDQHDNESYIRLLESGYLDAVINALEERGWHVHDPQDGTLEIERWTEATDYDMVLTFDMRDRDPSDPQEWADEARELADSFDPAEEAALWYKGPGAPPLADMLADFTDVKGTILRDMVAGVMESCGLGADNMNGVQENTPDAERGGAWDQAAWRERLVVIESRQQPDGTIDALIFDPGSTTVNAHTPFIVAQNFDEGTKSWGSGSYRRDLMDALCDLRGTLPPMELDDSAPVEEYSQTDLLGQAYAASAALGMYPTDAQLERYDELMSEIERRSAPDADAPPSPQRGHALEERETGGCDLDLEELDARDASGSMRECAPSAERNTEER